MIFCAGRGTRMGELTRDLPKPMIEVAGRPLVDHAIAQLAGVGRLVANLHYFPEKLATHLASAGVETVFEPELLETGGGLKNALDRFTGEAVFTMNTDAVWKGPRAAEVLAAAWDPTRMDALLLTVPHAHAHGHAGPGDFDIGPEGHLVRGRETIYTGLQILRTSTLDDIAERCFSLNTVWERLLETKRIFGAVYPGEWCDVGHPEGIAVAERVLKDA
ncbi:MurNAc alpha-1-phosphate uridylyltransferase [Celeribacter indicus]|nr:MurNAc alpha-1-phosphate uridylyltransferase [Celeribacter indicus]